MTDLPQWADLLISFFLVLGSSFAFIGSLGLLRLPDFMARLHAPTKNTTLGVGSVIIASMLYFSVTDSLSLHELLIAIFLFLTAPISAHLLAKAGLHLELEMTENTRDLRKKPEQYSDKDH
ncbi:Na+/H+ antiporter subunit G [Pseudidiomarina terrestris]|uniref:Na+/H+ antiporter subunit G n=1 Tax=Pseudidiomarina terrestris TaxID=2820060 RepID=A0AAW7R1S3_9GAMM|nr:MULTISPECIES: Na+/H+ antiporter subunit G [unclassified Pseudidiomarina]MDN7125712.1 Na+/H+ antiporter subunit G [Pseudidiomarina sp. 1APP75-32.1]MDN7128156.1 Na+/H+ antiporter subunit G [Pseudidiomarina sp. 1APR75-33.1]MDN7130646.1 Na+/H+ antiporter subunit G [Pseudidiomarina sp. 1APR75-15]MDN7136561.1 Na+/H+ antiporter subunit G [Pseudidiomarina sp. 1ASP75-5]MDN7138925.1 Na+/H+ antiporter subunit G [Pseudidiomarina sp. 1ASP75-14]